VDRTEPAATDLPLDAVAGPASGVGETFRAIARGTGIERRRRSLGGAPRAGRGIAAADASTDSGSWRLAL